MFSIKANSCYQECFVAANATVQTFPITTISCYWEHLQYSYGFYTVFPIVAISCYRECFVATKTTVQMFPITTISCYREVTQFHI
jgi:hypothetical protein